MTYEADGVSESPGAEGAAPAAAPGEWWTKAPEKYITRSADGNVDQNATGLKLAEGYAALQDRMRVVGAPPKSPQDYKLEKLSADLTRDEVLGDPYLKKTLEKMHGLGLTDDQASEVLNIALTEFAPQLLADDLRRDVANVQEELRSAWGDEFGTNLRHAWNAATALAQKANFDLGEMDRALGNNAAFLRLMAVLGPEIGEDGNVNAGSGTGGVQSIEALETSEAYTNPKHPQHEEVSTRVRNYYARRYPGAREH